MNASTTGYVASPYLKIDPVATPNRYRVLNRLSGRAFEGSGVLIDILRHLKDEQSFQDICQHLKDFSTDDIRKTLDFLTYRALVFRNDIVKGQLVQLTRIKNTLFGLSDEASPAHQTNICFVGVPFGGGNHESNGSAHFPDAVRALTHKYKLQLDKDNLAALLPGVLGLSGEEFTNLHGLLQAEQVKDLGNVFVSIHESKRYVYEKITTVANRILKRGDCPFFLGGDHSITYPILKAVADHVDDFYLIHIDAHTDTYESIYDQVDHDEKVHHHGNYVTHALELPSLKGVYQYGIRGILNLLSRSTHPNQHIVTTAELKQALQNNREIPAPPLGAKVYVSLDIDVLDPAVAPGTATPVANGLSPEELLQTLRQLLPGRTIIGLDLVEVNPQHDVHGVTVQLATELLLPYLALARSPHPANQNDSAVNLATSSLSMTN